MGWTLEQIRDMDADDYDELVAWSLKRAETDDDSMDMDQVIEAKTRKPDGTD
jgi:hypothetical protein